MSTRSVDERVVEMRFDNENFEKNAQQSLTTLQKLQNALSFKGATDGLKNVDSAARGVNMSGLGNAVENVRLRFSALEVVGVTALANITNRAVDAGLALTKSLSVDQISAGWSKYAEKTTAVQTIMAATASQFSDQATQMAEVNRQLEKLSWFTDETSYNFVDMVSNIGKFTSNNIGLETSVTAMQGIANWAAISGANATEASRAMYNLSQAIGVGALTAIDWKSIENANMATAEFKQTVIETAESMGTLKKVGDGLYETLEGNEVSVSNFREALKDKWLTNDILTTTLEKYGKFTTKLNSAFEETGKLTSELLDDIDAYKDGTLDLAEAAKGSSVTVERYGEIIAELGDKTMEFGMKSFRAAQETKTFAEVIDYTKDAVSSQWMKIFETIFGDYTRAKKLWTNMSEDFYTLFVEPLENAASVIDKAFGSKWDTLTKQISDAGLSVSDFEEAVKESADGGADAVNALIKKYGSFEAAVASGKIGSGVLSKAIQTIADKALGAADSAEAVTQSVINLEDVVRRVIRGEFGNGQARVEALTQAGYDYATVQDMVNKTIWGQAVSYEVLSEAQLKSMGYTDEQIAKIKELRDQAADTGSDLNELLAQVEKPSGRALFTDTLSNGLQIIIKAIQIVKDSWRSVFPETTAEQIYHFLEVIHNFSENTLTGLGDNSEKIGRTLRGIFNVLDLFVKLIKGGFRTALKLVNKILSKFDLNIWDITAAMGDWLTHIHDVILGTAETNGVLDTLIECLANAISKIVDFVKRFGLMDRVRSIMSKLASRAKSTCATMGDFFKMVGGRLSEFVSHWKEIDKLDLDTLKKMLKDFKETVLDKIFDTSEIKEKAKEYWTTVSDSFSNFGSNISFETTPFMATIGSALGKVRDFIKDTLGIDTIFEGVVVGADIYLMTKLSKVLTGIADLTGSLTAIKNSLTGALASIKSYFTTLKRSVNAKVVLEIALAIGILAASLIALAWVGPEKLDPALKALWQLAAILGILTLLTGIMNKLSVGASGLNIFGLAAFAVAIAILSKSIKSLKDVPAKDAYKVIGELLTLTAGLVLLLGAFNVMTKVLKLDAFDMIGLFGLIGMAIAMRIMIKNLVIMQRDFKDLDLKSLQSGFLALLETLAILSLGSLAFSIGGAGAGIGILAAVAALKLFLNVLNELKTFSVEELKANMDAIKQVFLMFAGLMLSTKLAGQHAKSGGAAVLMMSAAVIILVEAIKIIADVPRADVLKGVAVISALMLVMGAILYLSQFAGKESAKAGVMFLMMAAAIGILVGCMYLIAMLAKDEKGLKAAMAVIAELGVIFGAILYLSRKAGESTQAVVALGMLALIIGVLAGSIYLLASIKDQNALKNATMALAILMGMFAIMEFVNSKAGSAVSSYGTIVQLGMVVAGLAGILGLMSVMGIENALPNAEALSVLLLAFTGAMLILSKIGPVAAGAGTGILELAGVVALIGGALVTIGGLVALIPGAQEFLDNGIGILQSVGEAIGAFFGGIVGGGMIGLSESFITMVENFKTACSGLAEIGSNADVLSGIKALSELVLAFGAAEFVDSINSILSIFTGGSDFNKFLEQISGFATAVSNLPDVDPGKIETAKNLAAAGKALVGFAKAVPNEGGLLGAFVGENDNLSKFGRECQMFARAISAMECGDGVPAAAKNVSKAGKSLVSFAETVPNEGGAIGFIVGENDNLSKFGEECAAFASAISGLKCGDGVPTAAENIAAAGISLSTFADQVPNVGGLLEKVGIVGNNNDLASFGAQCKAFADALSGFPNFDASKVASAQSLNSLVDELFTFAEKFGDPFANRQFEAAFSEDGLSNLSSLIKNAAPKLNALIKALSSVQYEEINSGLANFAESIQNVVNAVNSITAKDSLKLMTLTASFKDFATTGINALVEGFNQSANLSAVSESVNKILNEALKVVKDSRKGTSFKNAGSELMKKFRSGMTSGSFAIVTMSYTSKLLSVLTSLRVFYDSFKSVGEYLAQGLIKGIESKESAVKIAGYKLGKAGADGAAEGAQTKSPSKATTETGEYIGDGLVNGMLNRFGSIASTAKEMGASAVNTIADTISRAGSIIDSGIELNPTVRPVLDTSSITSGLNIVDAQITNAKALGLSANISGEVDANNVILDYISNLDKANGRRNNDVVSALRDLQRDFQSLGDRIDNIEMVMDSGELVGSISTKMDKSFGRTVSRRNRGI